MHFFSFKFHASIVIYVVNDRDMFVGNDRTPKCSAILPFGYPVYTSIFISDARVPDPVNVTIQESFFFFFDFKAFLHPFQKCHQLRVPALINFGKDRPTSSLLSRPQVLVSGAHHGRSAPCSKLPTLDS